MSIIQVNHLTYIHSDNSVLFSNVSFSVSEREKIALIGPNGSGKSTLLQLLTELLKPASGDFAVTGRVYYVPQHFGQYDEMTIAEALAIQDKINALQAILGGRCDQTHYDALQDDWEIEERAKAALTYWGLSGFGLSQPMSALSGGEKTRVFLSGISLYEPDIVLMDEPTNHLDRYSRQKLYDMVNGHSAAMLIVSHDRTLLNFIGRTLELGKEGVTAYGGNYEFYKEQKGIQTLALQQHISEKEKSLRLARQTAREANERKAKNDARGEKRAHRSGVPRIMMKTLSDSAAASSKKLKEVHAEKMGHISEELSSLRDKTENRREIRLFLDNSQLHKGKTLIEADGIKFSYGNIPLWDEPLSLRIASGERISLEGGNGSGKTTLLKLMLGMLQPSTGTISRADGLSYIYVDQEYSLIENSLTVYEQVQKYNTRKLPEHILKTELHRFLFPAETWDKSCGKLSGGEKMRLTLCSVLAGNTSPDLFILDEPTNNLDIESLEIVQNALMEYSGTLLIISHDNYFKTKVEIERSIYI